MGKADKIIMQDIPRNELLDKLAAGWKVRTKAYGKSSLNNLEELQGIDLKCLIEDDWEGEPPGPAKNYDGLDMLTAFRHLRGGAAFVRRTTWKKLYKCTFDASHPVDLQKYEIGFDDILATDWEVWG